MGFRVFIAFVAGADPDQDYIDNAMPPLKAHMMMASERLAALIVDIYGSSSTEEAFITSL